MKCSCVVCETPLEKRILRHQQLLLLAAHASSPRIKKGRWASQDHTPKERGQWPCQTRQPILWRDYQPEKDADREAPLLNEEMTGFCHIGSSQLRQAERKAMAHERTRTKFSAQLRSDVMDAMYAAANAIFCMRNCNCNCAALLRLP